MKKSMLIKMVMLIMACVMAIAGCTTQTGNVAEGDLNFGETYPLDTDVTLTYWTHSVPHPDYANYKDQPFYKELMARTGVNVDYQFAPAGQGQEAFNILIASNKLPDIIMFDWFWLPGGPDKYMNEGYITELNDYLPKYAPSLSKYLSDNPNIDRMVKNDSGTYYAFPCLLGADQLSVYAGFSVRKDLLDEYGLEVPTTIDEWHDMLVTFKNNGVKMPLSLANTVGEFCESYNVGKTFYLDDNGEVKYGPIEDGWKDCIVMLKQWYDEDLIDKDFGAMDWNIMSAKVAAGDVGASQSSGFDLAIWDSSAKARGLSLDIVATPYPTLVKGERPRMGQKENLFHGYSGGAITKASKNKELAAKFLDYAYSEEGHIFYNYGIEGESYTMVDGMPTYTRLVLDGDMTMNLKRYTPVGGSPSIQDPYMYDQLMQTQIQKDAIRIWADTDASKYLMPPVMSTAEEAQEMSAIMTEISTYVDAEYYKFIFGERPISEFDAYVDYIKELGIERVLELKSSALKRFYDR